jgi:hypothetical protein
MAYVFDFARVTGNTSESGLSEFEGKSTWAYALLICGTTSATVEWLTGGISCPQRLWKCDIDKSSRVWSCWYTYDGQRMNYSTDAMYINFIRHEHFHWNR